MSNYTSAPPFDGPSGYAQPWPLSDPSRPGMLPQNYPMPSDFPGSQNEANNMGSFQANSHLPGLGVGAPGQLPPPPFPFIGSLTPSQFAPPFPPVQMPFLGYPPMPVPGAPNQQQQPLAAATGVQSRSVSKPTSHYDQEEGEVTDRERTGSTQHVNQQHAQGAYMSTGMDNHNVSTIPAPMQSERASAQHQGASISEAEEGEASSVSRASSRASGSPYNPPMSVTADSPLPGEVSVSGLDGHSGHPEQDSASLGTQKPQNHASSETTRAQLRIQAQGALLRLAPHNIRFHELVGEGINPMVLRQLYEEVGIKVSNLETGATPVDNIQSRTAESGVDSSGEGSVLEGRPHSSPQSGKNKPMERKEVIARMLAAKAAKTSASPNESVKESSAVHTPRNYDMDGANSPEPPSKEKEAPIREKNKAQTELARKRIDELKKKQDLLRGQQKSQADYVSQELQSRGTSPPINPPIRIEHPLPERPPLSEAPPARLPGLSVVESSPNAALEVNATSLPLDPTPQSRVTQRKRPRASDFDEPADISEDSSQRESAKLVIDLSDDEFYGDDENDHMDIETPALGTTTSSADLPGLVQQNARGGDQENIRKKDQEIQAMRQKIAELEKRKKARLAASNTQSPIAQSTLSLDGDSAAMDLRPGIVSPAPPVTTENYKSDASNLDISQNQRATPSSPKDLLAMDLDQLEAVRLRFLRKREIESGLPDLESEIENTAAKLSGLQKDEQTLLQNITKGRQGRQRLLEELGDLGLELSGLTLEQVEAAQRKLESRNSSLLPDQASTIPPSANIGTDFSVAHTAASSENIAPENTKLPEETKSPAVAELESENRTDLNGEGQAPGPYGSDSAGSAMDESSGSSSSDTSSDSEDSSEDSDEEEQESQAAMDERADGNVDAGHHTGNLPGDESQSAMEVEPGKESESGAQGDERHVSRASSVASEAYEPPEPEADSGSAISEYVPAGPGNEESDMTEPFPSQPQTDESLTGNVQENGVNSGGNVQNAPEVPINEHKFSPYISPLRYFKSYRYHPNYSEDVLGGYRSLTYSHNIDAMKYLCPFEVAGGVCNDQSCDSQHFGSMALSDDKILVQMGSLREGKTPEEKDQYITGLKQIINDMRRDKVKEFNTVATEIAAYRRRFLQDPSRVLPL